MWTLRGTCPECPPAHQPGCVWCEPRHPISMVCCSRLLRGAHGACWRSEGCVLGSLPSPLCRAPSHALGRWFRGAALAGWLGRPPRGTVPPHPGCGAPMPMAKMKRQPRPHGAGIHGAGIHGPLFPSACPQQLLPPPSEHRQSSRLPAQHPTSCKGDISTQLRGDQRLGPTRPPAERRGLRCRRSGGAPPARGGLWSVPH